MLSTDGPPPILALNPTTSVKRIVLSIGSAIRLGGVRIRNTDRDDDEVIGGHVVQWLRKLPLEPVAGFLAYDDSYRSSYASRGRLIPEYSCWLSFENNAGTSGIHWQELRRQRHLLPYSCCRDSRPMLSVEI